MLQRWRERRQQLLDRLGDGLLVLPTASEVLRNGDVHHAFRPGSDFSYLTGFPEPESVLVAWRTPPRGKRGKAGHHAVLFVRPKDKTREIWDGRRYGVTGALKQFGVDETQPIEAFWPKLTELLPAHRRLFYTLGRDVDRDLRLFDVFARVALANRRRNPPAHPDIVDPSPVLGELRQIKDDVEIEAMRHAANVTAEAHVLAMQVTRPGMTEYQVQAALEEVFRAAGSQRNGYDSIVASGPNACILHYTENTRKMRGSDLLLIDAGAEIDHYTADITRTFPVGEAFSPAQAAVYRVVLAAQKAAVRACQVGKPWDAPHKTAQRALTKGLVDLGVLRGSVPDLVKKEKFKPWYMHGTSHWLGADVHDVGPYFVGKKPVPFRPGMVLTVEPGLYFDKNDKSVPRELRGIGVRIEDDVLITKAGPDVLTAAAPKDVREIERLRVGDAQSTKPRRSVSRS